MAGKVRSWFRRGSIPWLMCLILALTAVFFVVSAGIFWIYNSVEVWNGQTLRMIYRVGTTTILTLLVSLVGLAVTIVMARYAYTTIAEMRKDRRKDLIEKVLVDAYSPLYEILRRARARFLNEPSEMQPRMQYDLEEAEFTQAPQILMPMATTLGPRCKGE
jgi:hypothetical protein